MLRIYRLLLYLYPASFRVEYGDQLWRDVGRRRRDVKGAAAAAGFWIAAIADIANNASRVQWDVLRQDLHYTRRLFRRAPAFALTAIAVSALGIGATTATFSMADHVLLRPLPFHEPDRLVRVWEDQSFRGYPQLEVSPANFRDWQHMSHSFASLAAYADSAVNMLGQGSPERLASANVTANLFDTLGVSPALGRSFTADDDRAGAAGTVILSHRLWQSHFGGDPRVVGRTIVLNDERFAVIGVMRADFEFPSRETTLWVPFRWVANDFDARDNFWLYPIARLRNGTTLEDARAEMKVIAAQLERAYPKENERTSAGVYLLRDGVSDRARLLLMALAGGSVCILLIACINLASLLVARALSRQREFAVRCAIGAGRERLVRQMLTESVVLAGIGGMAGLALAAGGGAAHRTPRAAHTANRRNAATRCPRPRHRVRRNAPDWRGIRSRARSSHVACANGRASRRCAFGDEPAHRAASVDTCRSAGDRDGRPVDDLRVAPQGLVARAEHGSRLPRRRRPDVPHRSPVPPLRADNAACRVLPPACLVRCAMCPASVRPRTSAFCR